MEMLYWICAIVGGVQLVALFILTLVGGDTEADVDVGEVDGGFETEMVDLDGDSGGAGLKTLSLRTIAAFLTFFGLAGLAADHQGWTSPRTFVAAAVAGAAAFFGVAWVMSKFHSLRSSGSTDIRNAIGHSARVYLAVPGERSGEGKVTVTVQGRSLEFRAVTAGESMTTGAACRVVSVTGPDTLVVEAAG